MKYLDAHIHVFELLKGFGAHGEFRPIGGGLARTPPPGIRYTPASTNVVSVEEALVLRQVPAAGATVDAVARAAQLPVAKVNALLVALRLKGRVRFLPGNRVASR